MQILNFLKEVHTEVKKVVWPKPRDTVVIVAIVAVVVFISSLFFLCVDYLVYSAIDIFLAFGGF
jgi:preprotein translocase SecE subunit